MADPVALFGATPKSFTEIIIELRKKVKDLGFVEGEGAFYTLPHLTLAVCPDFTLNPEEIKVIVDREIGVLEKFPLQVKSVEIIDNNIVAVFDNFFAQRLAGKLGEALSVQRFKPVVTNHMRLIRSKIKEENQEEVRQMVEKVVPREIEIFEIALAGKLLREEDILWRLKLQEREAL